MAASLTLASAAIATDGKTLTATISGGTGTGYALGSKTGIIPHLSGGNAFGLGVTSASVSGTTLTVNLTTPAGSGETFQLDFPSSVTLTDDGGNTPTGQTNLAVTNNSTVTVTTALWGSSPGSFELAALGAAGSSASQSYMRRFNTLAVGVDDFMVEFSANCTEAALICYSGNTSTVRIDGATSDTTIPANGFYSAKPLTTSPLTAGNHLFLCDFGDYFFGVRLSGGTRTITSVATAKQTILPNTGSQPGIPNTTNITPWGAWKVATANRGDITIGQAYSGFRVEFGFVGTGCEVAATRGTNSAWSASVDTGVAGALVPGGVVAVNNFSGYVPLVWGKSAGSHTLIGTLVGSGVSTSAQLIRLTNGTAVTSAAAVNDGTLQVASIANISSGDWLRIDTFSQREWRQVTGISGTGPYTLTLNANLAKTHASGVPVSSYAAAAGSFFTWVYQDESVKRVVGMGDSNTQGANDEGFAGTPDASGTYYAFYDPRRPPLYLATHSMHMELVNLGVQGQTTAQMETRAADINALGRGAYDYVVIWPGTNDINSGTNTPTAYQTSVANIVAACTNLRAGGKIILCPPGTPTGITNSGGLNLATAATAMQNVAAANPTTCVYASTLLDGVNAAEINGVHYHPSGQQKIANNLLTYIGGSAVGLLSSGFFAAA